MTEMNQARLDAYRNEARAIFSAAAEAANALHAANGCSYCRQQPYNQHAGRPLFTPTRFSWEDITDDETGFAAEQHDSYDYRETKHLLTILDRLLADPAALAEAVAAAQAEHDQLAAKLLERATAKEAARERDERATLRRLAQRYPEELGDARAPR